MAVADIPLVAMKPSVFPKPPIFNSIYRGNARTPDKDTSCRNSTSISLFTVMGYCHAALLLLLPACERNVYVYIPRLLMRMWVMKL